MPRILAWLPPSLFVLFGATAFLLAGPHAAEASYRSAATIVRPALSLKSLNSPTPTSTTIEVNVEPAKTSWWDELGAPLFALAGAGVGAGGAIWAGRITAKSDSKDRELAEDRRDKRQQIAEQERQYRQRREDVISSIQLVLDKIGDAWNLSRDLDDRRLLGQMSQDDYGREASKVIEELTDVGIAKSRLPTAALEDLAEDFVRAANRVVRQRLYSNDPALREEMNRTVTRFEEEAKPVLREAKYGAQPLVTNGEKPLAIDGEKGTHPAPDPT
jgi:hypothetical protein